MKAIRQIGSLAFVVGLFTVIFAGVPWHVLTADDPRVPWWLRIAVFGLLGGILVVLLTVALEQKKRDSRSRPGPYGICYLAWQRPVRPNQVNPWRRID
ncbi:MAG: hypothetical protein ACYS6W_07975 [Planctomycetota bacterium]